LNRDVSRRKITFRVGGLNALPARQLDRDHGTFEEPALVQQSAFGYMRLERGTSADESDRLRQQMAECVAHHGLALGEVFVDWEDSTGSAFAALIDALRGGDVTTVVVPSMRHLAHMEGVSVALKEYIENQSGARILISTAATIDWVEKR